MKLIYKLLHFDKLFGLDDACARFWEALGNSMKVFVVPQGRRMIKREA
jgi:hypothetical protein